VLSTEELQELNIKMLGLGMPIRKDGEGYNKPDYTRMEYIGMLNTPLSFEEAYITVATLRRYKNTQLASYKDELEDTFKAYRMEYLKRYPEEEKEKGQYELARAARGEKHGKKDYNHYELFLHRVKDNFAYIGGFQERLDYDYIKENFNGRWFKFKEELENKETIDVYALRIAFDKLEEFVDYIADKGRFGYSAPENLLNIIKEYKENNNDIKIKNEPTEPIAELLPTGKTNKYGYDLYDLTTNDYSLNQQLWELKGKGLSYLETKEDTDKVTISSNNFMLPYLLEQLKSMNINVTAVENYDKNKSGNTLIDVSKLDLPFKPYDFQVEDAQTVVGKKKALLGHDMGCGKTFISALVGMSIPDKKLVICPETLRLNWKRELEQAHKGADIKLIYSKDKDPQFGKDWTIMGYKTAVKFAGIIMDEQFNCMFVDEAHKCKSVNNYGTPSSQQAKTIMKLSKSMDYTYLLTGTPMPTRNKDLYNELVMLGEINDKVKYAFMNYGKMFCDARETRFGWDYNGSSNTEVLHQILCKYMTRRLKTEVLPNLTKQRQPILIETPLSKDYRDIEKRMYNMQEGDTYMGLAMTGRRHLSKCKTDAAIEFAETILEGDESVVLVAEFNETLQAMMEHFGDNACCIKGGMPDSAKQQAIDEFQSGQKKVCCINLIAAGVGITLTKAHNMVVCDYDWTPANMTQVEDRICRTGQTEPCNIFYICHEKAILDQIFMEMITDKSANIDKVVDNAENTVDLVSMYEGGAREKAEKGGDFLERLKAKIEKENKAKKKKTTKRTKKSVSSPSSLDNKDEQKTKTDVEIG